MAQSFFRIYFSEVSYSYTDYYETDWIPVSYQFMPADITPTSYDIQFGNYSAVGSNTSKVVVYYEDDTTTEHTISTYWNTFTLSKKPIKFKFTTTGDSGSMVFNNVFIDVYYQFTPKTYPTIMIGSQDIGKVSDEEGFTRCTVQFGTDQALDKWEARATPKGTTPARGVGILVHSGTTVSAGGYGVVYVDYNELTDGDSDYIITIYGHSSSSKYWSDGTYEA